MPVRKRSPAPATRALLLEGELDRREERAPRANLSALGQRLRPVGVVDVEDEALREDVGAAEARGVERVAFDLRRPPLVALRHDAPRVAAVDLRRRVEERLAGHELLGSLDVRIDALRRLARASRQTGQRDRRAHQREQLAAVHARVDRHAELPVQVLPEILRLDQLLEAAPVLPPPKLFELGPGGLDVHVSLRCSQLYLWHVVQSVNSNDGRMWYCAFSRFPISSWLPAGT